MGLLRLQSLKKNSHFRLVYNRGRSLANRLLVMYVLKGRTRAEDKPGVFRLGLSVSKKLGCAVRRNKIRRRIKEAFRLMAKDAELVTNERQEATDIIVIARQGAASASYAEIREAAVKLLKKHGLAQ